MQGISCRYTQGQVEQVAGLQAVVDFILGSSSSYYASSGSSGRSSNPVSSVIMFGGFFLMANAGVILFVVKSRKASSRSYRAMRQYQKFGDNWDIDDIQKQVKNAYFVIQEC